MKNLSYKIISILLAVLMATTCMPLTALADEIVEKTGSFGTSSQAEETEETGEEEEEIRTDLGEDVSDSGMSNNCIWSYDSETKTMTVGGTTINGCADDWLLPTYKFNSNGEREYAYRGFKKLVIEASTISMDNFSLLEQNYPYIESIEIKGATLTRIGAGIFAKCTATSINIPNSVKEIDGESFIESHFTSITLPSSLNYLGDMAFARMPNLETVNANACKITACDYRIFEDCENLKSVDFSKAYFYLEDDHVADPSAYDKDYNSYYQYSLPQYMFSGCKSLESVKLNTNRVKVIGDNAFYRCKNLTDINLGNVRIIGKYAFFNCQGLTKIDLSSVRYIDLCGFTSCGQLESVKINPALELSVNSFVFSGCEALSDIDLSNVANMGAGSFSDTKIKSIHIKKLTGLEEGALGDIPTLESVTYDSGKSIPEYFLNNSTVKNLNLPSYVTTIGEHAFDGTTFENKLVINSTSKELSIGAYAFYNAKFKDGIDISNANISRLNAYTFAYSDIESILIPSTVDILRDNVFRNCISLKEVVFDDVEDDDTYIEIGQCAFWGCKSLKSVVTEKIESIASSAFYGCTSLTDINIKWVNTIGAKAFMNCSSLETIDMYYTYRIDASAFENCVNLKDINCNLLDVGNSAFKNCESLESVNLENAVSIGSYAFKGCEALKEIVIKPGNEGTVGSYAFSGCKELKSVFFGSRIMSIGCNVFDNCEKLTSITFMNFSTDVGSYGINLSPELVVSCGFNSLPYLAAQNESINRYVIEVEDNNKTGMLHGTMDNGAWIYRDTVLHFYADGETEIGANLLDANGNATTVSKIISDRKVTEIIFDDSITNIPDNLFKNLPTTSVNNLTTLKLPKNLKKIGDYAFYYCPDRLISLVKISDEVEYIGDYAFGKTNLSDFDMSHIKHIGEGAFAGCVKLKSADLSGLTDDLGAYAFDGTINLANVVFPNVARYEAYAFRNAKLTKIVIPAGVKYIGKRAFCGCKTLTRVDFKSKDTEIYFDENNRADGGIGYTIDGFLMNNLVLSGDIRSSAYKYAAKTGLIFESTALDCDDYGYVAPSATSTSHVLKWYYYGDEKSVWITGNSTFKGKFFDKDMNEITDWSFLDIDSVTIADDIISLDRGLNSINPKYIYLPETMSYLSGYAFAGCTNLRALDIPDSVFSLGDHLFDGCTKIKSVHFGSGVDIIPAFCMAGCTNLQFLEMDNVNRIKTAAFKDCSSLLRIDIPDSTEYIDDTAFINCHSVMEINLGKNILYIGDYAFANMPLCYKITFNSTINVVRNDAFSNVGYSTTGVDVVFGDSIAEANLSGFTDCNIATINVGSGFKKFINIPRLNSLVDITVSNNSNYYSYEHCLYSGTTLVYAPQGLTSVDIKEGTKSIGDSAFMYSNIQVAKLPEGIRIIGDNAFKQAENLKAVRFPNTINSIGNSAFEECLKLKTISIPYPCQYIGDRAFKNCKILASVLLPEGLFTIGDDCFNGCVAIERMVFPRSLVSIGAGALAYNPNLKAIYVWNATLGYNIFYHSALPMIYTMAGSNAHGEARTKGYPVTAFADEEMFAEICFEAIDDLSGYLGYCVDGHGEIEWLTVYKSDCENDGYEIGVCEYCSEILDEHHTVATGHRYTEIAYIRETATDYGIRVLKCDGCGEMLTSYYRPLGNGTATEGVYNVSGKVYADNGKAINNENTAIENAEIYINGSAVARTGEDGSFRFKMKSGNYIMEVRYAYGFTRYVGLSITDHDVKMNEYAPINIVACDFNKDGKIDAADQTLFMLVTASKVGDVSYLKFIDLNNDGYINAKDYVIINRFYGATALTYQYPELTIK